MVEVGAVGAIIGLTAALALPQVRTAYNNAAAALYQAGVAVAGGVRDAGAAAVAHLWEDARTRAKSEVTSEVRKKERPEPILFHYTDAVSAAAIVASGVLLASDTFTSKMPKGAYATNVEPWAQMTKRELSYGFYGHENANVSWYVVIEAPDFYSVGAPYDPRVLHYTRSVFKAGEPVPVEVIYAGPNPMP